MAQNNGSATRGAGDFRLSIEDLLGNARRLAAAAEPYPFNFVRSIRGVISAQRVYQGKKEQLKTVTGSLITPVLIESPSLAAIVYGAAAKMHGEALSSKPPETLEDLTALFECDELLAVLCLGYLMRRLSRHAPEDEWGRLCQVMYREMELATLLAQALHVSNGDALLFGAIRHLAFSCYLIRDPRSWSDFKRQMRKGDWCALCREEIRRFSANHIHIASVLLIDSGLGMRKAEPLNFLYSPIAQGGDSAAIVQLMHELDHIRFRAKISPVLAARINEDAARHMQGVIERLNAERDLSCWLGKRIEDLPRNVALTLNIRAPRSRKNDGDNEEESEHE